MDIGFGYDSEDSFVDDSEAVCTCDVVLWISCTSLLLCFSGKNQNKKHDQTHDS